MASESGEPTRRADTMLIAQREYTMSEYLDNPVWHALAGPHAHIANGRGLARHYPRDMVPFSGALS